MKILDVNKITINDKLLSCPEDWLDKYRNYMNKHKVPYEEVIDGKEICFIIPSKYRPHAWRI